MTPDLSKFNKNGSANPEAITEALTAAEKAFGRSLPADYMSFMRETDGGEGVVGDNYLELWRAGELVEFNNDYVVEEFAPGLLLFGGDGANELYAFDTRQESMPVVIVPGIGMSLEDAEPVADSFDGLLARLTVDGPFDESDEDEDEDEDEDDESDEGKDGPQPTDSPRAAG